MNNSPLLNLSTEICHEAIYLANKLCKIQQYVIADQLRRACSSIGANIREAQFAEGKKDFIHKLNIALKECNESIFWLSAVKETNLIEDPLIDSMKGKCHSVLRMLNSAIKTTKIKYNI